MDQQEFVRVVIQNVLDVAVRSTRKVLTAPPGRHPTPEALSLARWYADLSESDRNCLNRAIRETADAAVFGFLCLLDGARSVGDGKAGTFQLSYLADNAEFPICPGDEDLHDIYSGLMSDQRLKTSASNQPTEDL